jgi:hypothetical protein
MDLNQIIKSTVKSEQSKTSCPPATQDIKVNIRNRQKAIDEANYGPLNPKLPNNKYWSRKAAQFKDSVEAAKSARCSNCAAFIQTPEMMSCIEKGLGDEPGNVADKVINKAGLGFCEIYDFKCAGDRTCDAWVVGGPITK